MPSQNLITTIDGAEKVFQKPVSSSWKVPKNALMVTPDFFDVEYAINPFMTDQNGKLKTVDKSVAHHQWKSLKEKYESLGIKVNVIPGQIGLPDMVFAANQSLVFWHNDQPTALMSRMKAPQRREEVSFFDRWYHAQGYAVRNLETTSKSNEDEIFCEGNGDILLDHSMPLLWGGVGPRTNIKSYEEISTRFNLPIVLLPLKAKEFYHLDTCFSILSEDTVALQESSFDEVSLKIIRKRFKNVVTIDRAECLDFFAGNCHSPNGKDVILHKGTKIFKQDLQKLNFNIHEVDTSEFMKSGGSVFCMKMMVF
ncbi:MAG: arginine deiminase family protein [Proteobacteria bacterium]|nr:arginine deiminase family protein [Pseudomonadota bacterium]